MSARSNAAALALPSASVKTASDYIRALKRRIWMVLVIAVPLAITGSIYVLRMPAVYVAKAEIEVRAPQYDPALSALVSQQIGSTSPNEEKYAAYQSVQLKKRILQDRVVANQLISSELTQYADPASELFKSLNVTQLVKGSDVYLVSLEGTDPARTAKLLELLLSEFEKQVKDKTASKLDTSRKYAEDHLGKLKAELKTIDENVMSAVKESPNIGPGGRNILEDQYLNYTAMISGKQSKMADMSQQMLLMEQFPKLDADPKAGMRAARIEQLRTEAEKYTTMLEHLRGVIRNLDGDPAARKWAKDLNRILNKIDELESVPEARPANAALDVVVERSLRELEADREEKDKLLVQMQASMPNHQRFLSLLEDRRDKARAVAEANKQLSNFDIMAESLKSGEFVEIPPRVAEPTVPTKPNRPMLIIVTIILSLGLGVGLVCMLEHIDKSVKVPEHVTTGLTLPLLGVVPRIRRSALTQRGSHLWTPGTPDSLEADAYRNVRASLLGVADRKGPIVTLLVTSAKAGEGKSTTALNLAATCARAGERTLLLDIDLRRPSLADVFISDDDEEMRPGLVDVLSGEIPWQSTLRHTDIPNLDFIPTGDTRTIPIEILGTLELHQLLVALSHHYDRVILDGPAVLGLADCRFLGRLVDASILVVRSGSHVLNTLHRAKAMLEQSHVVIAGVVFNGLTEDLSNWSSYGYEAMAFAPLPPGEGRRTVKRDEEFDGSEAEEEAYALAGSRGA